jgi:hypothetical protein
MPSFAKNQLHNLKHFLPVFDQSNNLKSISLEAATANEAGEFAKTYLAIKPREQQKLIVKRLSKVLFLNLKYLYERHPISINTVKVIAKYLTGLKDVKIVTFFDNFNWTSLQREEFFECFLDISAKKKKSTMRAKSAY